MLGLLRRFYLPLFLAMAVIVPYALDENSSGPVRDKIQAFFASSTKTAESIPGIDDPQVNQLLIDHQSLNSGGSLDTIPQNLTPTVTLDGVLRFDIRPDWVMHYWPHVSTTRIDGPLDGLRVPIITGTTSRDLVGSLTYYFDAKQTVQRISMSGVVGDTSQLVRIATSVYKLKPEPQAGVDIYTSKWNGHLFSALWLRRMAVVHKYDSTGQNEFAMELNRPSDYHGLSEQMKQRITNAHATRPSTTTPR